LSRRTSEQSPISVVLHIQLAENQMFKGGNDEKQEDGFAMGEACIRFRYFRYPAPMLWRAGPGSTLHVENCARQVKPC
jgi:hypothetical protein